MKIFKTIILIFFFSFTYAFSEVIKKIDISGNERVSGETIKVYGDIRIGQDYSTFQINEILKKLYATEFFETVNVKLINNTLFVKVDEYSTINSIIFEGEETKKLKVEILKRLELQEKGSFVKSKLSNDINIIKKLYASLGFNFVEVESKIDAFDAKRLNLYFFINKGDKTKISKISFIGDKQIKEKRLRDIIVSQEHKFWKLISKNTNLNNNNIELDKRLLKKYYKSLGYYDVQIVSSNAEITKENTTTLTFSINSGQRYKISKISANVSEIFDKKTFVALKKEFTKNIGDYYSPFIVSRLLASLDLLILDNDLQFVEHSVNEIISDDKIEIQINIFESNKELVEKINILGNTITNEAVIRGELLLDEGDPFTLVKLDQSVAKLKSRNLFDNVTRKVKPGSEKNLKQIDIAVIEKPTGEISAGAGVGTAGTSFEFAVRENNWLGKGVRIGSNFKISAEALKFNVDVTDPNYNFSGNALSYNIGSSTNDLTKDSGYKSSLLGVGIGTAFEQYRDVYISPSIQLSHDTIEVNSTASSSMKKQKGDFTELNIEYGIKLDKRNRSFNPTSGFISSFSQTIPLYADQPSLGNTYNFSKYQTFSPNVIGSFKFYAAAINAFDDDVRINKRLFIPQSKLRGFKKLGPKDGKDFVGGNYASVINFEASLPNFFPEYTKTDVGAFLDIGNLWGVDYSSTVNETNEIRSTAGAAINWVSPVGPMSFILSQNITKASTDESQTFNFRLGTTF
jgi:outer membrane protein insertion porin family